MQAMSFLPKKAFETVDLTDMGSIVAGIIGALGASTTGLTLSQKGIRFFNPNLSFKKNDETEAVEECSFIGTNSIPDFGGAEISLSDDYYVDSETNGVVH
jgi:hypothetical protein